MHIKIKLWQCILAMAAVASVLPCAAATDAQDDSFTVTQGQALIRNAAAGLQLNDSPPLTGTTTLLSNAAHGTAVVNADGSFTYTPHPNFIGQDTFTYRLTNTAGGGGSGGTLVGPTAAWKFLHPLNGVDPATAVPAFHSQWFALSFPATGWLAGSGLMAYGGITGLTTDTDIGTPINQTVASTAYFRHVFQASGGTSNLLLRIIRDDAAIVYLNGTELVRSYQPTDLTFPTAVNSYTLKASAFTFVEQQIYDLAIPNVTLLNGANVLAISLHNVSPTSSDLGLQVLELSSDGAAATTDDATVTVQVTDAMVVPLLTEDNYSIPFAQALTTGTAGFPSLYSNDALRNGSGQDYDPILEMQIQTPVSGLVTGVNQQTGNFTYTPEDGMSGDVVLLYRVRDKDGWSAYQIIDIDIAVPFETQFPLQSFSRLGPLGSLAYISRTTGVSVPVGGPTTGTVSFVKDQVVTVRVEGAITASTRVNLYKVGGALVGGGLVNSQGVAPNMVIPLTQSYELKVTNGAVAAMFDLCVTVNAHQAGTATTSLSPYMLDSSFTQALQWRKASVYVARPAFTVGNQFFQLNSDESEEWDINLTNQSAELALPFRLRNPGGQIILNATSLAAEPGTSTLHVKVPAAGSYVVEVLNDASAKNFYVQASKREAPEWSGAKLHGTGAGGLHAPAGGGGITTFASFGDYGITGGGTAAVATLVKSWVPDFILTTGDALYNTTWTNASGVYYGEYMLKRQDGLFPEQTSNTLRFLPVIGNHDVFAATHFGYFNGDSAGPSRLPDGGSADGSGALCYHFTRGPIDIFVLDCMQGSMASQLAWLATAVGNSTKRWKFLAFHYPMYSVGQYQSLAFLRGTTLPAGINAIFVGHDHNYQRWDLGNGRLQFVTGLGGTSHYNISGPTLVGTARCDKAYNTRDGAMRVKASETGVRYEFINVDNLTIDTYEVGTLGTGLPQGNGEVDEWTFYAERGTACTLTTTTPTPPGNLLNAADPKLEVLNSSGDILGQDSNSAPDGKNAVISVMVLTSGVYRVKVTAETTSGLGEYLLNLTRPATGFDAWALQRLGPQSPPEARLPLSDPNHDQVPNLIEYALDLAPDSGNPMPVGINRIESGVLHMSVTIPIPSQADIRYILEKSSTLRPGSWTTVAEKAGRDAWLLGPGIDPPDELASGWDFQFPVSSNKEFYQLRYIQMSP
jgi:tartrate-resistant acid phosphatase type 5